MPLVECAFVVTGKVQGVFFRKFTQAKAIELGLVGTVGNCPNKNAVQGRIQGESTRVDALVRWLTVEGSPASRIDRCSVTETRTIPELTLVGFNIVK